MKFLYDKVYSNQYFALILFTTIAVLLVLFIIVLIAAIRDAKKTKIAELNELEKEEIEDVTEKELNADVPELNNNVIQEVPEKSPENYEFFANEDEQSKTMDIVLTPPEEENSMSGLLNEFDSEKPAEEVSTSLDELLVEVDSPDSKEEVDIPKVENSDLSFDDIDVEMPVPMMSTTDVPVGEPILETTEMDFSQLLERNENEDYKKPEEKEVVEVSIDDDDDFELPKTKGEEKEEDIEIPRMLQDDVDEEKSDIDLPEAKIEDIKPAEIDLGATGVLDFSNIESESYDIRK